MRSWCSSGTPGPVSATVMVKWLLVAGADAHFSRVRKFDGVTYQVEQHLREPLFVTEAW